MSNYPDVDQFDESDDFNVDDDYSYDDGMDGDFDSAMASAGFGMDEDYNHWAEEF